MRRMLDPDIIRRNGDEVVINEAVVISDDGDIEVGKNAVIDGDVVVNGVENFKDPEGNPIDFGGGGTKLYRHYTACTLDSFNATLVVMSTQSTVYADKYDLILDLQMGKSVISYCDCPVLTNGSNGLLVYYESEWQPIMTADIVLNSDTVTEL